MAQSNWEADKMLDVYIHDYLLKRKLHNTAKLFMEEGKVATDPVAIDAPGGFLFEWWSVFWDIFIARTNEKHSESAAAYLEAQQIKTKEQQQLQMQHMQLMQQRNAQLQRRDPNNPNLGGSMNAMNSEAMMGQPSASVLAMKLYEERMKQPHSMDGETSPALMDASRMAFMKSATTQQGQLLQGNSGNIPAALQHIHAQNPLTVDVKSEVNFGASHKSMPLDPSSIYGQAILQSKSGLGSAGVTNLPLKGWPLTGIDQLRPNLGLQAQKQNLQALNQSGLTSQQQQILAQAQAGGNIGSSTSYGDIDPRRLCGVPRDFDVKNGQSARVDGSICSPAQSNSPRMMMAQMQNSSSQQQNQLQQQQLQQHNRKRKQHTSAGPANSTGTGNTVGPSPNSPHSTQTAGDGFTAASKLKENNSLPKSSVMYNPEGTGVIASSSNLLDEIERFGDVGSLDENIDSFHPNNGDGRDQYGTAKPSHAEPQKESSTSKSFTFGEVGCIRTRNSKVTCCHFSSDGKLLASAGHDKKVVIWNMDTLKTQSAPEEHKSVITDVRFRPNSTFFGTASFDKSVRLWDAANPSHSIQAYTTHHSPVMSLDFHPKNDLFCFCDNDNDIHYWKTNPFSCARVSKGGMAQVRFQPSGRLLAAASDKMVSVFDVETDRQIHSFQGHSELVNYICWDSSGDVLASVSQSMVKIWSLVSGECFQEFNSNGNQLHSCVFHPTYSTLLVIGEISSLELWNMAENKSMTIPAHENIISALAQSSVTRMVASASHDSSVKLWK